MNIYKLSRYYWDYCNNWETHCWYFSDKELAQNLKKELEGAECEIGKNCNVTNCISYSVNELIINYENAKRLEFIKENIFSQLLNDGTIRK